MNGGTFEVEYAWWGEYVAAARIDLNGDGDCLDEGEEVGTLTVIVIDVLPIGPIACQVGYTREKRVWVDPFGWPEEEVHFGVVDPDYLGGVAVKEYDNVGAIIYLRPLQRGTPVLTARVNGETGPIVAYREVDEFTMDTTAAYSVIGLAVGVEETYVGAATLTMSPLVPNISVAITMRSPGATFVGGASTLTASTNDFTPDGDKGVYGYDIYFAPEFTFLSHDIEFGQYGSRWVTVALKTGANGKVCNIRVKKNTVCVNSTGHNLRVKRKRNEGSCYVNGVFAPAGGPSFTAGTPFQCTTTEQESDLTFNAGANTGTYGVKFSCEKASKVAPDVVTVISSGPASMTPDRYLRNDQDFPATITGCGFPEAPTVTTNLDPEVTFSNVQRISPTEITLNVTVASDTPGGFGDVTVDGKTLSDAYKIQIPSRVKVIAQGTATAWGGTQEHANTAASVTFQIVDQDQEAVERITDGTHQVQEVVQGGRMEAYPIFPDGHVGWELVRTDNALTFTGDCAPVGDNGQFTDTPIGPKPVSLNAALVSAGGAIPDPEHPGAPIGVEIRIGEGARQRIKQYSATYNELPPYDIADFQQVTTHKYGGEERSEINTATWEAPGGNNPPIE